MGVKGKFLGPTKGNQNLNPNRSTGGGGSGEPHTKGPSGKFLGPGKGNTRGPAVNRSSGGKGK